MMPYTAVSLSVCMYVCTLCVFVCMFVQDGYVCVCCANVIMLCSKLKLHQIKTLTLYIGVRVFWQTITALGRKSP